MARATKRRGVIRILSTLNDVTRYMVIDASLAIEEETSKITTTTELSDQVARWKQDAERIRLEAAQLDMALTLSKIEAIERKLSSSKSKKLEDKPDEREKLERQLEALQLKLQQPIEDPAPVKEQLLQKAVEPANDPSKPVYFSTTSKQSFAENKLVDEEELVVSESIPRNPRTGAAPQLKEKTPLYGFDEEDLKMYLPIAQNIEQKMPNATIDDKLAAFRADPVLRAHFENKIRQAVVEPMEDIQRLDDLKKQYLASSSSVEKTQLKREIDQTEKTINEEGVYTYSDNVCLNLAPMTDDELQARLEAVGSLPLTLQALYKRAQNANADDSLELAIMLDYYEQQMQLLEQVAEYAPMKKEMVDETRAAVETLPTILRNYLANKMNLKEDCSVDTIVKALGKGFDGSDAAWSKLQSAIFESATGSSLPDLPEYSDIDFVDRSRYIEELYPHVARMEGQHPSLELVNAFAAKLGRRTFMVTSKPERVLGGWYVKGENQISDDPEGVKLMAKVEKMLDADLKNQLEYFYIENPSPMADELIEMGYEDEQLFLVTAKDPTTFYDHGGVVKKVLVTSLGIAAVVAFSVVASEFQPAVHDQIGDDITLLAGPAFSVIGSLLAIQILHEAAHRAVAFRDDFAVGLPSLVPSVNLGMLGAITPIESPPPSLRSLFDFSLAGPLAGLAASIALLVYGLNVTASLSPENIALLPALPTSLLRSSALGGGLIEFLLGKGALHETTGADTFVPLHSTAIAGFVGMFSNALALLPLGNTDGGRISVSIFGRHIAFVINAFTLVMLCVAGLLGADGSDSLLLYSLFCVIWQRELEGPVKNEVQEVDLVRSGLALATGLVVVLALAPLPA
ncbi:hypothetical protein MPSEU_000351100 [Mayamaea pseudoterrestris]|nr:hypothetical protein MPSEU_000351100 [Mayamaea pseudoterrestris]